MGYLFETELRDQAEKFIRSLAADGIQGSIAPDGFRDYLVKVIVARGQKPFGNINLYYSPNKQSFSLKTHELKDKSIIPDIEAAWTRHFYGKQMPKQTSVVAQPASSWEYEAYVDGSYIDGPVGYGTLILKASKPVFEIGATVQNPTLLDMRQVGGELQAVYTAIEWCQNNHVQGISIYYDYEGIERWATGSWKANNPATQAYASFIRACGVQVAWNKVKSHSGNPWNEYVDRLARQGSQSQKPASTNAVNELSQVLEKAKDFVASLQKEKIFANVTGILNGQFIRVMVQPRGQVDIYCTRKRTPEEPYLSNFTDPKIQQRVESLWKSFYRGEAISTDELTPKVDSALAEIEYFYKIMAPYRDCWFDFSNLAKALEQIYSDLGRLTKPGQILEMAHDFNALETIYQEIKEACR
jgi:ribonuclease HI